MEGHRFFDLVRWGKAVETLNEKEIAWRRRLLSCQQVHLNIK
ncbi:RagB/SusD family nutrient uptake outer membrane protein [Bacteroides thetaiotaomicron]|nr:RagB/SusD family nutrient uptake outer membrane protein [Bacteroides thetaiotaomicron]MCS2487273.1 RagB/SusD family nutrient uptake outer membrane protein [Bacteroides thetaiotaomicron]